MRLLLIALALAMSAAASSGPPVRFETVEVWLDADAPLAAWQIDLSASAESVTIVGIEGGEHPAFGDPPYYDPAAIQGERVIMAAFSTATADQLPSGPTRIATLHVQISGDSPPRWRSRLDAAATTDGSPIIARLSLKGTDS